METTAEDFLLPLVGESWRDLAGESRTLAGPMLQGEGLVASAVHVHDNGESVVLRCVNVTAKPTRGHWTMPYVGTWKHRRTRLNGTAIGEWVRSSGVLEFDAGPREVVTLELSTEY
ncbi:MAG: hypothetical protein ABMA00_22775 [Gemmatimonas sp.]